jgi:hypothetical protein
MSNLLLGWLSKVNPTAVLRVAVLIVILVTVVVATLTYIVILGPSDDPTLRVVLILEAIGDMIAGTSH